MGFGLDVSRVDFDDAYLASMEAPMKEAFARWLRSKAER